VRERWKSGKRRKGGRRKDMLLATHPYSQTKVTLEKYKLCPRY
jgi:hypothetical protein